MGRGGGNGELSAEFRFTIRRNHGDFEIVEIEAVDSMSAVHALPSDVTSWDFKMWDDGSFRQRV
jgi:hypothetical protein